MIPPPAPQEALSPANVAADGPLTVPPKDQANTQERRQSDISQENTSHDQRASDQRASSTIEEGIMGLKYLPNQ